MREDIDKYMSELIDHMEKLKGFETLIDTFYQKNIAMGCDAETLEEKDDMIYELSKPYSFILDQIRGTISFIDDITNKMDSTLIKNKGV